MIMLLVFATILLHSAASTVTIRTSTHPADVLKVKCDTLLYRTAYFRQICYFVIDAHSDWDTSETSNRCGIVLRGSQFIGKAPDEVWKMLFVDKIDFRLDGDSTRRKSAMCFYVSPIVYATAEKSSSREEQKMDAKMHLPFRLPFTDKVDNGQTMILKGNTTNETIAFHIKLQSGALGANHSQANISLHMEFRFDTGKIILSARKNGAYTSVKFPFIYENPYKQGDSFDIRIQVHRTKFQIFLEQKSWQEMKFQLPLSSISHLYMYANDNSTYLNYVKLGEKYKPVPYSTSSPTSTVHDAPLVNDKNEKYSERMASLWATTFNCTTKAENTLPYLVPLSLESGRTLIIKGITTTASEEFYINLQSGTQKPYYNQQTLASVASDGDIPLQICVSMRSRVIVLKTITKGVLGDGKDAFHANPYGDTSGANIDVRIRVNDDRFQVFVEKKELAEYKFRVLLSRISHLQVYSVSNASYLNSVNLTDKRYSIPADNILSFPLCNSKQSACVARTLIPSQVQLADCKTLIVSGVVEMQSFIIKLYRKNGDIALLFQPCFDFNNVALNSFKNGQWLAEEIVDRNPFKKNVRFDVSITNEARGFDIFVNEAYFATFEHRTCSHDISLIEVHGILDLNIQV